MTEHTTPKIVGISTGFLAGNLPDNMNPGRYAESLRAYLEAEFPGAEVSVPWQANASGATPAPLQTCVTLEPDGPHYYIEAAIENAVDTHFERAANDESLYDTPPTVLRIHECAYETQGLVQPDETPEDLEEWLDAIRDDYTPTVDFRGVRGWGDYTAILKLTPIDPEIPTLALYYLVTDAALKALEV
jgi:hypothetical protein